MRDMDHLNCYIEFEFSKDKYFTDLLSVFEKVKDAKNNSQPKEDSYWIKSFPDYSLRKFYFLESDNKPEFETAKEEEEHSWHFYSLIELLQSNYDIKYQCCLKSNANKGRLEYYPFGYPYGGIEGLVTFVGSFNCKPTIIDDGTGIYSIKLLENGDFVTTDLTNRNTNKLKKGHLIGNLFKKWLG